MKKNFDKLAPIISSLNGPVILPYQEEVKPKISGPNPFSELYPIN